MNLFDMFPNETKEFEESQKKLAEKNKAVNDKESESKKTKAPDKKESDKKVKNQSQKPKVDPNKTIIEESKKYSKIVVKAYGTELIEIDKLQEVETLDLPGIESRLINEFQYGEFSEGINWHLVPNSDKSIGYLVATGKFYAKG